MSLFGHSREPWGRRLLADMTTEVQEGADAIPVAVVFGITLTLTLVILVALCACGESDDDAKLQKMKKKSSSNNIKGSVSEDDGLEEVQVRPKHDMLEPNGVIVDIANHSNHNSASNSRQSQGSTSSQIRPTSLRELPDLPSNSAILPDNLPPSRSSQISNDDYDHLGRETNSPSHRENYDHINLESPTQISEASPSDLASESHYAQVNDRTYEACNGAATAPYNHVKPEPPYNRIRDESGVSEDNQVMDHPPYNNITDEPPYNRVEQEPPYNTVTDDPPYNQVKEEDENDTYNHIRIQSETTTHKGPIESHYELDPLDGEDPYTMVENEDTEHQVTVVYIDRSSGCSNSSDPFQVPGSVSIADDLIPIINSSFGASHEDDYAVVNKDRNCSTVREPVDKGVSAYTVPPEPPRAYGAEEINSPDPLPSLSPAGLMTTSRLPLNPAPSITNYHEREYSKVSARESLASMSARHALNPYEVVEDNENAYATVDGASGDGIVTNTASVPPSSPLQPINSQHSTSNEPINSRQFSNQPINSLHFGRSQSSETYAEIGASAGGGATPNTLQSAPVPPSLDSLHSMKKHERRHLATPEDTSLDESLSHASPAKRSSFSPTTALPGLPIGMSSSLHENDVILEPNYQSVKDSIDDSENDPNYESVDDAKAKFPETKTKTKPKPKRQHHYEEVSPTTSEPTSPNNVRTRVLNKHTYEDIDDIKKRSKSAKQKPGQDNTN